MNLIRRKWFVKKGKNVKLLNNLDGLTIDNQHETRSYIFVPNVVKIKKNRKVSIDFKGHSVQPENIQVKLLNAKGRVFSYSQLNSLKIIDCPISTIFAIIVVEAHTKVQIESLTIKQISEEEVSKLNESFFDRNILLVSPGYPTNENKYSHAFVHSRVKAYKEADFNVDVAVVSERDFTRFYNYEDIEVVESNFMLLRSILQTKKYDVIIIHFFSERYAQILSAIDLSTTKVYLFSHGADTNYRDWNKMTARYFQQPQAISASQEMVFKHRDLVYKRISERPNIQWVFVTEWTRKRSEELNQYKYRDSLVIPCLIDEKKFVYKKKDPELRKKIFILRKFDDINTYSIDIDVRVILELSKREIFNDLEFNIYGDGTEHDRLLEPIKDFDNVHIHKKFLNHEQIVEVHQTHGIGLFATRYDSQAVSSSEAAMSGVVVISSNIPGVRQVINPKLDTLCEVENYVDYADKIEELFYNPERFQKISQKMHEFVFKRYGYDQTIKKDLELLKNIEIKDVDKNYPYQKQVEDDQILLSIVIPSYNVERFLKNTVRSVITHDLAKYLEVLIINDGSKDKTVEIAKEIEDYTRIDGRSIVKVINKENGGHGSTINTGIEFAKGKYLKLLDGDDYFNTDELVKLINSLKDETVDIILTNFIEDYAETCTMNTVKYYEFMVPGLQYDVESLCFKDYGFYDKWGPLLSTSTYRTTMLKEAKIKLTENCYYVDMELNFLVFAAAKTFKYLPYDIYVYYLGRPNQSIAISSYCRNYLDHEKITFKLIDLYYTVDLGSNKKKYLFNKIVLAMVEMQYYIMLDYLKKRKPFLIYDAELKKYPEVYNHPKIATRKIQLQRITKGFMINIIHYYIAMKKIIKRVFHKN